MSEALSFDQREAAFELARRHLIDFCFVTKRDYEAKWFHEAIASSLEGIEKGRIRKLIIQAPPRCGKTELCTIQFPAWLLGRHPDWPIICATYNDDLAGDFGGKTRDLVSEIRRVGLFPELLLKQDTQSKTNWKIAGGASITYTGIGGTITGKGAKLLLIEDPIKNQEEANSKVMRDKIWGYYNGTLKTRLEGNASIVIVMTRWNEDDLVGRILRHEPEGWVVLSFPMIAEKDEKHRKAGDVLWPEKWGKEEIYRARAAYQATPVGRQIWASLYQQHPYTDEGAHFLAPNWTFRPLSEFPDQKPIQAWDTAMKVEEENDNSACFTGIPAKDGHYVKEVFAKKLTFPALLRAIKTQAEIHKPNLILIEDKASGTSAIQTLRAETSLPIKGVKADVDKLARAQTAIYLQSTQKVILPQGAAWVDDFIQECSAFPYGEFKDRVDAFSHYANEAISRTKGLGFYHLPGHEPERIEAR